MKPMIIVIIAAEYGLASSASYAHPVFERVDNESGWKEVDEHAGIHMSRQEVRQTHAVEKVNR